MAKMTTKRCYWVDWICTFDKSPTKAELKAQESRMKRYLKNYLAPFSSTLDKKGKATSATAVSEELLKWNEKKLTWELFLGNPKTLKINWAEVLKPEWDQLSMDPRVFNFKAFFEVKDIRYTDIRGSMTPPPPPPPPGNP
jgi:hypothetical protein